MKGEDSGFSLTDRDPGTWLGKNKPIFNWDTYELEYKYNQGDSSVFYWALPKEFLGSKLGAYGGNLTVLHRGVGTGEPVKDSKVIIRGNGLTIHYGASDREEDNTRVMIKEDGWFIVKNGAQAPVKKEEFLKVLSNIEVKIYLKFGLCQINEGANIVKLSPQPKL